MARSALTILKEFFDGGRRQKDVKRVQVSIGKFLNYLPVFHMSCFYPDPDEQFVTLY